MMMALLAEAMHGEAVSRPALACAIVLSLGHLELVSRVFLEQRVYICDPLLDVVDRHFSRFIRDVDGPLILIKLQRF